MKQETMEGHWNQISGKITEKWGEISDQELEEAKGNKQQLLGLIQEKTGETRQAIENYLNSILENNPSIGEAVETAREYASSAAETAQEAAQQAAEQVKAGYIQTERFVRNRPMQSVAVCFGVGLVTGLVTGLLMRSR